MRTTFDRLALSLLCPAMLLAIAVACQKAKVTPPGIPQELAIERKAKITNVRYDLFFDIPATRTDSIPARVTIRFDWKDKPADLQLDYLPPAKTLKRIEVNGKTSPVNYENEHILFSATELTLTSNTISIDFIAGEAALNRNEDYLYTLFVPSRASTCFPVFDQPDLKAIFKLDLLIPSGWKGISNGKVLSLDSASRKQHLTFAETRPTSSYQFAFAAGQFREAVDPVSGMRMLYRETDSLKIARNVKRIFELHRQSLDWLQQYTGIPYPYDKFDFALMPAFQFGGMEHPGSIFYRESSLILEPSASVNEELRRASLIAHETAHMWFGNLVTMQWFNDVWLKEVFANFMASKMVSPSFPTINHELRFMMAHYPAAYEIDRSRGTHPIQQPLDNLRNAGSVYGAIIYQKAPIMMRNLEAWMGPDNFQHGLQDYLHAYSYGNATWDDLVNHLKKYTREDLELWNRAWIKSAGMPEIRVTPDTVGRSFLTITNDTTGIIWPQTFEYKINSKYIDVPQKITFRTTSRVLLTKWVEPGLNFIPNYKGRGYGYFPGSLDYLQSQWPLQTEVEVRAGIWLNLWEIFLRENVPTADFLQHLLSAVEKEKDPLLLEYLVDKLDRIFWQFLVPAERSLLAGEIDTRLFDRLVLERDNSCKRTLFNAYRSMATSEAGVANLRKLWADELTLGLELSERDRLQLAYALALRQVEGFEGVLTTQLSRITNPDRKAEVQFILPALSADSAIRDEFFERLKKKENRTREPWVLEAVRLMHHPLRADASAKYLPASFQLLEELQRTGDIFFPKGWLDATLGYYQSREAAGAVRSYLEENKALRTDLRNKLLQSSDMLFRAEQRLSQGHTSQAR